MGTDDGCFNHEFFTSTSDPCLATSLIATQWSFIFTAMAIRDFVMKKVEWEDIPTPTSPIQVISVKQTGIS